MAPGLHGEGAILVRFSLEVSWVTECTEILQKAGQEWEKASKQLLHFQQTLASWKINPWGWIVGIHRQCAKVPPTIYIMCTTLQSAAFEKFGENASINEAVLALLREGLVSDGLYHFLAAEFGTLLITW